MTKTMFRSFVAVIALTCSMSCFGKTDFETIKSKWNAYLRASFSLLDLEKHIEIQAINHAKPCDQLEGKLVPCSEGSGVKGLEVLLSQKKEICKKKHVLHRSLVGLHEKQPCPLSSTFPINGSLLFINDSKIEPKMRMRRNSNGALEEVLAYDETSVERLKENVVEYFDRVKKKLSKAIEDYLVEIKPVYEQRNDPNVRSRCEHYLGLINAIAEAKLDIAEKLFLEYSSVDNPIGIFGKFEEIIHQSLQAQSKALITAYSQLPKNLQEYFQELFFYLNSRELFYKFRYFQDFDKNEENLNIIKQSFTEYVHRDVMQLKREVGGAIDSYLNA